MKKTKEKVKEEDNKKRKGETPKEADDKRSKGHEPLGSGATSSEERKGNLWPKRDTATKRGNENVESEEKQMPSNKTQKRATSERERKEKADKRKGTREDTSKEKKARKDETRLTPPSDAKRNRDDNVSAGNSTQDRRPAKRLMRKSPLCTIEFVNVRDITGKRKEFSQNGDIDYSRECNPSVTKRRVGLSDGVGPSLSGSSGVAGPTP